MMISTIPSRYSVPQFGDTNKAIYQTGMKMCNHGMITREIRLENARRLARQADPKHPIKGLADVLGKPQALISNYIGRNPSKGIGPTISREIEKAFNLPHGWMDKEHAESMVKEESAEDIEAPSPSEETHVIIPRYNVAASCGAGLLNDHVEVNGGLAFMRSWLRDQGWRAADLVVIYARKDSMAPTITDGAVLLVDTSQTLPESGRIYVLNWFGEERVKRLHKTGATRFRVASDNPNKAEYPDEEVDFSTQPDVRIIGRVVWQGGTL